jgi:hypothetical protein
LFDLAVWYKYFGIQYDLLTTRTLNNLGLGEILSACSENSDGIKKDCDIYTCIYIYIYIVKPV